jgi:Holliday junction resolvase
MKSPLNYLSEAAVLTQVRDYLRVKGFYVMRIHQSLGSQRGVSDLIAIKDGKVIFIECKSQHAKSRQSGEQLIFQQQIEKHGGINVLARSYEDGERVIKSNKH